MPKQKTNRDFYGELFNEDVKPRSAAQPAPVPMREQQAKAEAQSPGFPLWTEAQAALARELTDGGVPDKNIGEAKPRKSS